MSNSDSAWASPRPSAPPAAGAERRTTSTQEVQFLSVATSHASTKLGRYLRARNRSPQVIAAACGGVESGWRNKMNGTRLFRLQDLVALAVVFGTDVLEALDLDSEDDLVPEAYRPYVEKRGRRLPVLHQPHVTWTHFGEVLSDWISREVRAGRGTRLRRDVIVHYVLEQLDSRGLPSSAAQVTQHEDATLLTWEPAPIVVEIRFNTVQDRGTVRSSPQRDGVHIVITVHPASDNEEAVLLGYSFSPKHL